jgi:tetratricopeptide (TPR) repeat protein
MAMTEPDAFSFALLMHRQGRLTEAEQTCLAVLKSQPTHFAATHLLGIIAMQTQRPELATQLIRTAIELCPDRAEPHYNLGLARTMLNRPLEALANYDRAIALKPEYAAAHNNRGNLLRSLGRLEEALRSYDEAIAHQPDHADAFNNRGAVLMELRRFDAATTSFARAVALRPDGASMHINLGHALRDLGRLEPALAHYDKAIALRPDAAEPYRHRGVAQAAMGQFEAALTSYDQALALRPDDAEAQRRRDLCRVALSLRQLSLGDYDLGWKNFEARWPAGFAIMRRAIATPAWTGDYPIDGKTILVHAEQGFGDTLQFYRYVPLLAAGTNVILDVPRPLLRLLRGLNGVRSIITHDDPMPAFDAWVPMMSLPLAFRTTVDSIPASVPYLNADAERTAAWKDRLAALPGRKIGLVWAGAPRSDRPDEQPWSGSVDQRRSITLDHLAPLAGVPDVCLISLQKGEPAAQTRTPPDGMVLQDWTDELDDFADTAALIEALDLVIGVDTSVVHLAGALGKAVWVLNRYDQCWRWLRDRTDSPWYPTARLFQQRSPGDWHGVIGDVVATLHAKA